MILTGETKVLGNMPAGPVPLCPPKIAQGLTSDRTRASAEGGDVARPGISGRVCLNLLRELICLSHCCPRQ